EKQSRSTVEISEESIHDSQIVNVNNRVSLRKDRTDNQGLTLSAGQTWKFLSQIGVAGGADSESMERRIEEMENHDANLYVKAMKEPIFECAEEDNSLQ
ncbi:hypothetical protein Ancab_029792, partial [Ancistrocladus abbreviatus]